MSCTHVYATATVTDAPEGHKHEIGTTLTICALCGYVAGAEKQSTPRTYAVDREESDPCQAGTVGCSIDHAVDNGGCEGW